MVKVIEINSDEEDQLFVEVLKEYESGAKFCKGGDTECYGALERTKGMLNDLKTSDDSKFGNHTGWISGLRRHSTRCKIQSN